MFSRRKLRICECTLEEIYLLSSLEIMEEQDHGSMKKSKPKGERRRSRPDTDPARDEIKKFKENLLQSVSTGDPELFRWCEWFYGTELLDLGDGQITSALPIMWRIINKKKSSILSDSGTDIMSIPEYPRSRSHSKAREALSLPADVLAELDENKIFELKEAFLLFDLDGDGRIDYSDLRGTLVSLGDRVDDQAIRNMMAEAPNPLDFDGFVNLLGYKTLELDSEETLVTALSRWDKDNSGLISEERIRHDLMTWGDRFTEDEADYALDEAPIVQKGSSTMIDYLRFCSQLCGLKKPNRK